MNVRSEKDPHLNLPPQMGEEAGVPASSCAATVMSAKAGIHSWDC